MKGIKPNSNAEVPPDIPLSLAKAYQLALKIKQAQNLQDPLELRIELAEQPIARLILGDVMLTESHISQAELDKLLGLGQSQRISQPKKAINLLGEIEKRIDQARGSVISSVRSIQFPKIKARPSSILIGGLIFLAMATPIYLIIRDRWLDNPFFDSNLAGIWKGVPLFSTLALPPYFLIIFLSVALLIFTVPFLKSANMRAEREVFVNLQQPNDVVSDQIGQSQFTWGRAIFIVALVAAIVHVLLAFILQLTFGLLWAGISVVLLLGLLLLLIPLTSIRQWIQLEGGKWFAMGFARLALLGLLASIYSTWGNPWILGVIFLVSLANLIFYRKRLSPAYWLSIGALVFFTIAINAWWFSSIGDEFSFFRAAKSIAEEGSWKLINENLFNGNYVYGAHPFFSTILQALFIKLFGANSFGWHISSIFYSAISIPPFYYFFKTFFQRKYALLAAVLLASSHYLASFGKIGYNNLQAFLALALVLAATAWVIRSRRPVAFIALGLSLAFCFYVYPVALFAVPLPYLILLFYIPPSSWKAVKQWAISIGSALIFVLPLFFQSTYWADKFQRTFEYNQQVWQTISSLLGHFFSNLVYSLFIPFYTPEEHHFVAVGYTDPITAALVFLGIGFLVALSLRKNKPALFSLLGFLYLLVFIGTSHDRVFPPATRMFLLLPYFAMFAAIAVGWIKANLAAGGFTEKILRTMGVFSILIILGLNSFQAYSLSYRRMSGYQNMEAVFLEVAQNYFSQNREESKSILVFYDPQRLYLPSLNELLDIYEVPYQANQISGVEIGEIDETKIARFMASPHALSIIDVRLPDETLAALSELMLTLNRVQCPVTNAVGDTRFFLWHSTEDAWTCPRN